jgi:hypothetical protein
MRLAQQSCLPRLLASLCHSVCPRPPPFRLLAAKIFFMSSRLPFPFRYAVCRRWQKSVSIIYSRNLNHFQKNMTLNMLKNPGPFPDDLNPKPFPEDYDSFAELFLLIPLYYLLVSSLCVGAGGRNRQAFGAHLSCKSVNLCYVQVRLCGRQLLHAPAQPSDSCMARAPGSALSEDVASGGRRANGQYVCMRLHLH